MKIIQECWTVKDSWTKVHFKGELKSANLVLCFGHKLLIAKAEIYTEISEKYPKANIVLCSTSGEISDVEVCDNTIILTAIEFEKTLIKSCSVNIHSCEDSYTAGKTLISALNGDGLTHIFVISDGQLVNGSELVRGLNESKPSNVSITGGLAGDDYNFNNTLVGLNSKPIEGEIVAIGFYGDRVKVGFGSFGGWDAFGPERMITKSEANILYELDGISALELYKNYLGDAAKELPGSSLFFPLTIKEQEGEKPIVRTILSIDEKAQSMVFAGDVPQGAIARLMKHNADNLIEGAEKAAQQSIDNYRNGQSPDIAILISCVGRKIVLGQNVEEEIEVVRDLVGSSTVITGFYSYGEIAPNERSTNFCKLHNQTMTITTITEI